LTRLGELPPVTGPVFDGSLDPLLSVTKHPRLPPSADRYLRAALQTPD
jgi:hypothetical protein